VSDSLSGVSVSAFTANAADDRMDIASKIFFMLTLLIVGQENGDRKQELRE